MIRCNNVREQAVELYPHFSEHFRALLGSGEFVLGGEVERWRGGEICSDVEKIASLLRNFNYKK